MYEYICHVICVINIVRSDNFMFIFLKNVKQGLGLPLVPKVMPNEYVKLQTSQNCFGCGVNMNSENIP